MSYPKKKFKPSVSNEQIDDIKLAVQKMTGHSRREFQATMALKYCNGNTRLAESIFGWGRETVALGIHELRTGIKCIDGRPGQNGRKLWEVKYPDVAESLREIAEANCQQDPTFNSTIAYRRLTAQCAINELLNKGYEKDKIPSASTMAQILNRMGYRLRKVLKAKPLKKIPETDEIFKNLKNKGGINADVKKKN